MQWENLTSNEFAQAVKESGVCVLPLGILEKHSDHMPLGTDYLIGHKIACLAAEKEKAMVFPPFYFGQIYEASCFPGTISIKPTILLELLWDVLDEIGRNGFKKIVLYNAHGGNNSLLLFLAQCTMREEKPYSVYVYNGAMSPARQKKWQALLKTKLHGHACECETSILLACHPELVKMELVPKTPAEPLKRLSHLPGNFSGISWYANYPDHYAGDARPATREKGEKLRSLMVDSLVEFIDNVKKDKVVPGLEREFHARARKLSQRT